jgi:hypothetical protein
MPTAQPQIRLTPDELRALRARAHSEEAKLRPDPLHRAVRFLLIEIAKNNRDIAPDAAFHLDQLDIELAPAVAQRAAAAAELAAAEQAPIEAPGPTVAQALKQSRRFKGRTLPYDGPA